MEQPKIKRGTVREDGLVFLRRSRGKEKWGTVEQYKNLVDVQHKATTKKRIAYKSAIKFKIGEQDSETGLYFIRTLGNYKPKFGTLQELEEYKNKRKNIFKNYKFKKHRNPQIYKRGHWDPILNLFFWKYNTQSGSEIWYTKAKFLERSRKENLAAKERRERKKHGKD